jgi:hypothetical protein
VDARGGPRNQKESRNRAVEETQRKEGKNGTGWVGRLPSLAQTAAAGGDEEEGVELEHSPESMGGGRVPPRRPAGEEAKENRR